MVRAILAIDQGTTNSKATLISETGEILSRGSSPVGISHPRPGWVEQDLDQIWTSQLTAMRDCLAAAPAHDLAAIGISNQRESVAAWDRRTGRPAGPLVSWQCRRTADACLALRGAGHEPRVLALTGLPLDPMFPATKLRWLIDNAAQGRGPDEIALGTVDSWLIWKLTGGRSHVTDASNAARTQLFDLASARWSEEMCALAGVASAFLPEIRDSAAIMGETHGVEGLPDGVPVASAIGDSHAALFGHGAFTPGDGKITFGTGSSVMTTIPAFAPPPAGITTTVAWSIDGRPTYAFEGNILVSAAILPWTAKLLGLPDVDALMALALQAPDSYGVSLVPAHVGLGAPHWDTEARGLISGLSFGAEPRHVARAAVESIALQVNDVFQIMTADAGAPVGRLFVDGGPSRNLDLMQIVATVLQHPVGVKDAIEASALGAGYLAGLTIGLWSNLDEIARLKAPSRPVAPEPGGQARDRLISDWHAAISRSTLRM